MIFPLLFCCLIKPDFQFLADDAAERNLVPIVLYEAIIMVGSVWNQNYIDGDKYGLSQIDKKHCDVDDILDPKDNLECGAKRLAYLFHHTVGLDEVIYAYTGRTDSIKAVRQQIINIVLSRQEE